MSTNKMREALEALLAKPSDDLNDATEDADGYFRTPYRRAEIAAHEALAADDAARGAMREEFEAWFSDGGEWPASVERFGESYSLAGTHSAWRAWQASRAAAPHSVEPGEFCWLVELFEGDGTSNSAGWYHTGFVDIGGHSRTTKKPHEARRYTTKEQAECVAEKLGTTLTGTWKAAEHGFAAAPQSAEPALYMRLDEFQSVMRGETQWEPAAAERHLESDVPLYLRPQQAAPTEADRLDAERWRPMRSAPKNGAAVLLLLDGSDIPHGARWLSGKDDPHATEQTTGPGWYFTWDGWRIAQPSFPRYWMPIPDDPDAAMSARPSRTEGDRLDAWIACSERMPEPETDVLCWVVDPFCRRFEVAGLFRGAWYGEARPDRELNVTHWRPLPAPPTIDAAMSAQAGGKEQGS